MKSPDFTGKNLRGFKEGYSGHPVEVQANYR